MENHRFHFTTRHCEEPKATRQPRACGDRPGLLRFARNDAVMVATFWEIEGAGYGTSRSSRLGLFIRRCPRRTIPCRGRLARPVHAPRLNGRTIHSCGESVYNL